MKWNDSLRGLINVRLRDYLERQYEVMVKRIDLLLNLYACFPTCKIKILSFISHGPGTGLDIGAIAVFPIFKE